MPDTSKVLVWDKEGERTFETGVKKCALYVRANDGSYPQGVAWSGITGITLTPEGAEATELYADNIKYLNLIATEDKKGTIKCYTYPDGWEACNGERKITGVLGLRVAQQNRATFGFTCRTLIGNDTEGTDYGYKIYIVYGATASPSDEEYQTVNDNPNAIEFSYEFNTVPVEVGHNLKPCAIFEILSTDFSTEQEKEKLTALENVLYGTDPEGQTEGTAPRLPSISEIIDMLD